MVTTMRSANSSKESFCESKSNVALLERENVPSSYEEFVSTDKREEVNFDEEKIARQKNLEKLLNYDRYSESFAQTAVVEETPVQVVEEVKMAEDDIRPTSTTMQFGDGDVDQMYRELKQEKEQAHESHKLNAKGKFIVVLYALAVTVIMALIIINTGVLSKLNTNNEIKQAQLANIEQEFYQMRNQFETDSSAEVLAERAESLGMIK